MESLDYTTLRKRTPVVERTGRANERNVESRARERSVEPRARSVKFVEVVDPLMDGWEVFKDEMMTKFPNVKFPDEYCDTDVITASVSGIDTDVMDVLKTAPPNVKFNVQQDGRLVVEFTKTEQVPVPVPAVPIKFKMPSRKSFTVMVWLLSLVALGVFIKLNHEKYKKLLWT